MRRTAEVPFVQRVGLLPVVDDPYLKNLVPAADSVLFKDTAGRAAVNLRLLRLAARAYLLDNRKPPATPADLVPGYLARLPEDPFTGQPLRMVLAKDQLTFYSTGPDGADDGGRPCTDSPLRPASKGDVVVTLTVAPAN